MLRRQRGGRVHRLGPVAVCLMFERLSLPFLMKGFTFEQHGLGLGLQATPCGHEPEPMPQQVPESAAFPGDLMRFGYEPQPPDVGHSPGVHRISFHFPVGDGFQVCGMGEDEVNTHLLAEIAQPIPACGAFYDSAVVAGEIRKILHDLIGIRRQIFRLDFGAGIIERCNEAGVPVSQGDSVGAHQSQNST